MRWWRICEKKVIGSGEKPENLEKTKRRQRYEEFRHSKGKEKEKESNYKSSLVF